MESDSTLTLAYHGVNVGLLIAILVFMFKQYGVYKSIRERVNIVWRDYCRLHGIPYNALGDDDLQDIKNGGHNH